MEGLLVEKVMPGSIAEELEIEPGDWLLTINGQHLRDIIDYNYFSADEALLLEVAKSDGEIWEIEVERDESEPLGLVFQAPVPSQCGNKCVFCFVHQLPKGLRLPLYVKDEDYRLSFLYGNYVTMANIGPTELERIKEQRLSPLYISVHATDRGVRELLLGQSGLVPILSVMEELAEAGIIMHTQVVLCPGINDGSFLEQTVRELSALFPAVASLAVVPLGLTRHRKGLPDLQPVTSAYAAAFVGQWQPRARELADRLGEPFLFFADEFYIKGNQPFPPLEEYGDLPQVENGVGMVPLFLRECDEVLAQAQKLKKRTVTVVTGESAYPYLNDFLRQLEAKTMVRFQTLAVRNVLFGDSVTVAGLVTGGDIIAALREEEPGELVLIPDVMLKEGEGMFLDDVSIAEVAEAVQRKVEAVESSPWGIYRAIA